MTVVTTNHYIQQQIGTVYMACQDYYQYYLWEHASFNTFSSSDKSFDYVTCKTINSLFVSFFVSFFIGILFIRHDSFGMIDVCMCRRVKCIFQRHCRCTKFNRHDWLKRKFRWIIRECEKICRILRTSKDIFQLRSSSPYSKNVLNHAPNAHQYRSLRE